MFGRFPRRNGPAAIGVIQATSGFVKITVRDEESARVVTRRRVPAVKSGAGVKFQKTITINRPVAEVYTFWRNFDNLPRFMKHVESVSVRSGVLSHWAVNPNGKRLLEWDAELIEDRTNELISWQSLPGADVDNAGSVWFKPAVGNRGAVVKVALKYAPPGGKAGAAIGKLFGHDAAAVIEEDLYRLKSLLETGEMPTTAGRSHGNND